MDISKKYRLHPDQFFSDEEHQKRAIVLHHTVSHTVESVFEWWQNDMYPDGKPRRIGTAYVVDKNGQVYEFFEPRFWAHHLGVHHTWNRSANQQSIGIELVNEGGLFPRNNGWFWNSGRTPYVGAVSQFDKPWRGFQAFAAYTPAQLEACFGLVVDLCRQFEIKMQWPMLVDPFDFDVEVLLHQGIFAHCNVRLDKSDIHAGFPMPEFQQFIQERQNHG